MIDLQINGFTRKDFSCDFWASPNDEKIKKLAEFEFSEGVEIFLATLITNSYDSIKNQIQRIADYKKIFDHNLEDSRNKNMAHIFGIHIEGGMISRYGVHPEKYSSAIGLTEARDLIKNFPSLIKLWTLCPQKDPQGDLTKFLQDSGIIVSYGHSNASYEQAMNAFDRYQVNLVTHWGNAMLVSKNFNQRNPSDEDLALLKSNERDSSRDGIGLAALDHPQVFCTMICGSQEDYDLHLSPKIIQSLAEVKAEKLILVSDSVAYEKDQAPEKLVGGLNSLKKHSANAFKIGLRPEIIEAACEENPAKILGLL